MQETTTNNIDMEAVKYFDNVNEILYKDGYINGNHYVFKNEILSYGDKQIANDAFKNAIDNYSCIKEDTPIGFLITKTDGKTGIVNDYDVTKKRIEILVNNITELNKIWRGTEYYLKAIIENNKREYLKGKYERTNYTNGDTRRLGFNTIDENVNYCITSLQDGVKRYLHKPSECYSPDASFLPCITDDFFKASDQFRSIVIAETLRCLGTYNGRIVLEFDKVVDFTKYGEPVYGPYYVGIDVDELVEKFRELVIIYKKDKKGNVIGEERKINVIKEENKKYIRRAIIKYCHYLNRQIKENIGDNFTYNYIMYNDDPRYTEEHISEKIKELWDKELGGVDIRTNTSLTESYMTMLGWYFMPVDISNRICGSFYSPASGYGKTAILKAICKRIDLVHTTIEKSNGAANQFTFTRALAKGPDILQIDDPMNCTEDVLNMVSRLVSNKAYEGEFKGKDAVLLEDLNTKVMITSNVPLYMKKDDNNFLTKKVFELQTNNMKHCEDKKASSIVEYISCCPITEVYAFINKCVKMFNDNPNWIKQHIGLYLDSDDEKVLYNCILSYGKLCNANNKTLIECVDENARGYNILNGNVNKEVQLKWAQICKHIKTHYPNIANTSVCSTLKNNNIYPSTIIWGKQKFRNYKLDFGLREILCDLLKDDNYDEIIKENYGANCSDIPF